MRSIKTLIAGLAVALLCTTGAFAGSDLNEVGAMLVYPTVIANDKRFQFEPIPPIEAILVHFTKHFAAVGEFSFQ